MMWVVALLLLGALAALLLDLVGQEKKAPLLGARPPHIARDGVVKFDDDTIARAGVIPSTGRRVRPVKILKGAVL